MYVQNSDVSINFSSFVANISYLDGGGLHFENSSGQIKRTLVNYNNASNRGGEFIHSQVRFIWIE